MKKFPFFRQLDQMDCGPTCLKMIAKHYGKNYSVEYLRTKSHITRNGVSFLGLSQAAEAIGIKTLSVNIDFEKLRDDAPLPCIAHWKQKHFVVVYKTDSRYIYVANPSIGLLKYRHDKFQEGWLYNSDKTSAGPVLILKPNKEFYDNKDAPEKKMWEEGKFLWHYIKPHKKILYQLLLGLIAATLILLIFPFTTQAIVDYGIGSKSLSFIYIILLGQLMLFISQSAIETVRSWLLLHLSARINISIISDFLAKIMKLPVSFFESKMTGDLLQRIEDNQRIENFLSSTTLNVLFSMVTLVIFGAILATYDLKIFFIFLVATIIYISWVVLFVKKRAILDYQRHDEAAANRSGILQLINGITEIKLNNSQLRRRWEWETIQMRLYKVLMKGLSLGQIQSNGANFINQLKNIIILIVAAENVVRGRITLGSMMAIQYIIGQLNAPINSLITFFQSAQDARLSIKRLAEIHNELSEEDELSQHTTTVAPQPGNISLVNASFRYGGTTRWVLNNVNLEIPQGKVTAIVGTSGSGKTTLLKLILKLYKITQGEIRVADENILTINTDQWRGQCGVVMQDGFIFSDTVARNITESSSDEPLDKERLKNAVEISNLHALIESLPNGYTTNLGYNGVSLSGGEKQRMLIARAVYKNPSYLFLDEATSSLDANNEKEILGKLSQFYKGRTVLIIAHRLSTVKNADQIVVMSKGSIVECGTHEQLVATKGHYFTLIKNQLELGN